MNVINKCALLIIAYIFIPGMVLAEPTREELEAWFNDDSQLHPAEQNTNTGQLVFLAQPPGKPAPHSTHQLTVTPDSIKSGWISIEQCHKNLDAIEAVEVVYRYQQMRSLVIQNTRYIGKAWVEGQSIQLQDVKRGAELCAQLEARVFNQGEKGNYFLVNGPFQRRFLDSYFPMHVSLTVSYPHKQLRFTKIHPAPQAGFKVTSSENKLDIDTWFEGKLVIGVEFKNK